MKGVHESKGVQFRLQRKVAGYDGTHLSLDDGSGVEADLVVVGTGVSPRVELARAAGLAIALKKSGGGVRVDEHLQTSVPGIDAVGDIASDPEARLGRAIRVEHWVHAQRQGQFVARLLSGDRRPFTDTPFFWSAHFGRSLRYVGKGSAADARLEGSVDEADFAVRYADDALATCGRDRQALQQELEWEWSLAKRGGPVR